MFQITIFLSRKGSGKAQRLIRMARCRSALDEARLSSKAELRQHQQDATLLEHIQQQTDKIGVENQDTGECRRLVALEWEGRGQRREVRGQGQKAGRVEASGVGLAAAGS